MERHTDSDPGGSISRRQVLAGFAAVGISAALVISSCGGEATQMPDTEARPEQLTAVELRDLGQSLIAMHEESMGGWRFRSAIQAPHYQADRDVGAAGVGMGFLVLADQYPEESEWKQAAQQTAGWLLETAQKDAQGRLYWADYVDGSDRSDSAYTSFDDGTLGISDFLWQLYERTSDETYRQAAQSSLAWTLAQAENVGSANQPVYRWLWDKSDESSGYHMGMGMGVVGIVHTLAEYYQRLKDTNPALAADCRQHIDGAVRYVQNAQKALGGNDGDARALPETGVIGEDGDTNMNAGYLSGSAGAAFMYLKLYRVFGDPAYLQQAEQTLGWLSDEQAGPLVRPEADKVAWKLAIDPQGGNNEQLATGFEEGAAGIGWVYLQAYKVTGNQQYLATAQQAANWLASVAEHTSNGLTWHEYETPRNPITHTNLNNGAAGIGMFFQDLAEVTGNQQYQDLVTQTRSKIESTALRDGKVIYWDDNDGEDDYSRDPSWHWGTAGIVAFLARTEGSKFNMPGMQSGL